MYLGRNSNASPTRHVGPTLGEDGSEMRYLSPPSSYRRLLTLNTPSSYIMTSPSETVPYLPYPSPEPLHPQLHT
ncbi:hypothetical protein BDV06DRAFT_13275 [Aspergillus oleicola]